MDLEKTIQELATRMRLLKAIQEDKDHLALTDRDTVILRLLNERGQMTVSEIASADPTASDSTISTNITKLWRDKRMVSKTISPLSQRVTIVEITEEGKKALETVTRQQSERIKAFLEAIQVTDEEREVLIDVFKRATGFMDEHFDSYIKNPAPIKKE